MFECWVAIILAVVFVDTPNESVSSNRERIESIARKMHQRFQEIRKSEYGNVHFTATYSIKDSTGFLQRRKIRFWARNDSMFRIDEEIVDSSKKADIGFKTRIVVRPEGFVELKNTDKGYAVTNFGNETTGRDKIEVAGFYAASTRCHSIMNGEVLFGPVDGMEYTNELSKKLGGVYKVLDIQESGTRAVVTTQSNHNLFGRETCNIYEGIVDTEHGVLLSYALKEWKLGDKYDEYRSTKEYNFQELKNIPKSVQFVSTRDGITSHETYVLDEYDSSPVPIGIFALGMKSLGEDRSVGPWTTRLLIGGIAFTTVLVYLVYLRRTRSS